MNTGKVYLIGAGPGDPELLTIKGFNALKKADVVMYDALLDKNILKFCKEDALCIATGKTYKQHIMNQDDINKLMVENANKGLIVARLKCGDPCIFGRGGEEALYLKKYNVPFEIIPGLSSALGVATNSLISLTHRDYSSNISINTGHGKDGTKAPYVMADTMVFLMAVTSLKTLIPEIIDKGKPENTPCVLIEKGTFADQKKIKGDLSSICELAKKHNVKPPAILIIGEFVNLNDD